MLKIVLKECGAFSDLQSWRGCVVPISASCEVCPGSGVNEKELILMFLHKAT